MLQFPGVSLLAERRPGLPRNKKGRQKCRPLCVLREPGVYAGDLRDATAECHRLAERGRSSRPGTLLPEGALDDALLAGGDGRHLHMPTSLPELTPFVQMPLGATRFCLAGSPADAVPIPPRC